MNAARILCVDDDPCVLSAYQRQLRKYFDVAVAAGGEEGLEQISAAGPFAVVVSDLRMPGMDGVAFLSRVRQASPDTVRMMLTGQADLDTAMQAVNEGNIFRFMSKPCAPETLMQSVASGVKQYHLVMAERELLEKTLSGSVKVLTDVLTLAAPAAFGRAARLQPLMRRLARTLGIGHSWQFEIAALLSQVGCISLTSDVLEKIYRGQLLTTPERRMFLAHPQVGHDLIANIPRLGSVAEIILYQEKDYNGGGVPENNVAGQDIPLGARALHATLDFDTLVAAGKSEAQAITTLRSRNGRYDPAVVDALGTATKEETQTWQRRRVALADLIPGMVLAEEITTDRGLLLVSQGQEVTPSLLARLRNFARMATLKEPFEVRIVVADRT